MPRTRRTTLFLLLTSSGLVFAAFVTLVATVPSVREPIKARWRDIQRPPVPEEHTTFLSSGRNERDPELFARGASSFGPTLHFNLGGTVLTAAASPAIIRRVGDVSDSLVSISAGFMLRCDETEPDLRIVIRIDHASGEPLDWIEKRLRANEHTPGTDMRFNLEWLLRNLPVRADDHIAIFLRNPDHAPVTLHSMDIVFRSASIPRPSPHA